MCDPDAEVGRLLGVHDRLGRRFGAGREDQLGDGVGGYCCGEWLRVDGRGGQELVERRRARAEHDVVRRDPGLGGDAGDQLAVVEAAVLGGREHRGRLRCREHVHELTPPVVGQERVDHRARRLDGDGHHHGLVPVRQLHRDDVAGHDAGRTYERAHPDGVRGQLAVRPAPAALVVDDRDRVRPLGGVGRDPAGERGVVPEAAAQVLGSALGCGDDVLHVHPVNVGTTPTAAVAGAGAGAGADAGPAMAQLRIDVTSAGGIPASSGEPGARLVFQTAAVATAAAFGVPFPPPVTTWKNIR